MKSGNPIAGVTLGVQDCTEGFLTPFAFHSNSLANWWSSGACIESKGAVQLFDMCHILHGS